MSEKARRAKNLTELKEIQGTFASGEQVSEEVLIRASNILQDVIQALTMQTLGYMGRECSTPQKKQLRLSRLGVLIDGLSALSDSEVHEMIITVFSLFEDMSKLVFTHRPARIGKPDFRVGLFFLCGHARFQLCLRLV